MNNNLMTDAVLTIRMGGETRKLTLPGVMAALEADEVDDFPLLRPHHRHPWHAFLCQLAVMALEEAEETLETLHDESCWRQMLRRLTPEFPEDEPWRLVVGDLSKPAFLQPPVPEGSLGRFKADAETGPESPLGLDVLVTSKQHGEKIGALQQVEAEDWILALMVYQTFSGYLGSGNYGIARQNGGFAARHGVSLAVSLRSGQNWKRDCCVLLRSLGTLRETAPFPEDGGQRLLWLEPWAGGREESLPLQQLHPLFIEVCRRIRLLEGEDGRMEYRATGTSASRVAAKEYNGVLGDPWLPVRIENAEGKAFNSKPHYSAAAEVLFDSGKYQPALLQRLQEDDPADGLAVVFRCFMRGQGNSDGYHERVVPIGGRERSFIGKARDKAAETAKAMVENAKLARFKVLKPALLHVLQSARDQVDYGQKETEAWAGRFADALDMRANESFFPLLWQCLELRGEEPLSPRQLLPWVDFLVAEAREGFRRGCDALPLVGGLRYRALSKGESVLETLIVKYLSIKEES
jgi:CRISPR system Cascade subunit CasA